MNVLPKSQDLSKVSHVTHETDSSLSEMLTPREAEIARLAAQGLTNKEIALTLEISHWTVATHLRRIYDKTSVNRRAALGQALIEFATP